MEEEGRLGREELELRYGSLLRPVLDASDGMKNCGGTVCAYF